MVNLPLLVACFYFRPRLCRLCEVALALYLVALRILVISIVNRLTASNPPAEYRAAIKFLLVAALPLLAEFGALVAVYRWRVRI